jgi:hypothetical protein
MSIGNCIIFHNTTVQKEIFVGIEAFKGILFPSFPFSKVNGTNRKEREKNKKAFETCRNGDPERSGSESCRIQSQEDQELGSPTAATTHIPQTSGVTQSVYLTNKGM